MKKALKRFFSLNPVSLTILLTLLVLVLFVVQVDLFEIVELKTYDFRFLSRGTKSPRPDVVLAALDEKSLKSEGRWPWPRSKMAKLIDALSRDGAKVIGFDIIFAEPDQNSNIRLIRQIEQKMKDQLMQNEDSEPSSKKARPTRTMIQPWLKRSGGPRRKWSWAIFST